MRKSKQLGLSITILVAAFLVGFVEPAAAKTIKVDCDPVALQTAVTDTNAAGKGKIKLASNCVYSIANPATVNEALPVITGNVSIDGGNNTIITRDPSAATNFRIFRVDPSATLKLKKLAVELGKTDQFGGGVLNNGILVLDKVTFRNNSASEGGGVWSSNSGTVTIKNSVLFFNEATVGGGILSHGELKVLKSFFLHNTANNEGGAINTQPSGESFITKSTFERNQALGSGGGAIITRGMTMIDGSRITFNSAGSFGGGVDLVSGSVTIKKSTIENNTPINCFPQNGIPGCVD